MSTKKENSNYLGCKFQIYEGDEMKIYRARKYKNTETIIIADADGNTKDVSIEELNSKYIRLIPDAFLTIMTTDTDTYPDVYVCVHKTNETINGKQEPDLILRQALLSVTKQAFNIFGDIYVGDCLTNNIVESGSTLSNYLEFENINFSNYIYLYIDDTMEDILSVIPPNTIKKVENVLASLSEEYNKNPLIKGQCTTLVDLMKENNFMARYREIFNILQVDFEINLTNNYNKEGDIILTVAQKTAIEDILRKYINNIIMLQYDKDIDVSKIVSLPHIMISDSNEIIYLIAYEEVGNYPIDDDIAKAMGVL